MPQVIIENGPQKGQRIALEPPGPFVVGRDSGVSVSVKDPMVSRRHCRIELRNGSYYLLDDGSANGTFLNGARRKEHQLSRGDRIKVGGTLLTFFPEGVDDPLIGKVISGFEVLERIGEGGMGTVYKARQVSLDRVVALKVLSKELVSNHSFAEAFHREARAAGQINHPSIVQVYDVDTVEVDGDEITFFAMEYMPGGSVEDLLNREKKLPELRALEIALDTARGLRFAESRGMVHRDIKPGNLMVSESGMVKIGDLGIARRSESGSKVSQEDGVSGSPHYISPEQARGDDLDSGADMYSLGVSLYHMLAGRPPFVGSSARDLVVQHVRDRPPEIRSFRPDLDPAVVALLERLMEKDRKKRHPDVGALVDELERTIIALKSGAGVTGKRAGARRLLAVAGTTAALLAIGAAAGIGIGLYRQHVKNTREKLESTRIEIQGSLEELEASIDARDLELAEWTASALEGRFEAERTQGRELEDLHRRFEEARAGLELLATELEIEERNARADEELARILAAIPADLAAVAAPEELDGAIAELAALLDEHPETPASERAQAKLDEVVKTRDDLARRIRRAREAFSRLDLQVRTLVGFDPPAWRSALAAIRTYIDEHPGTPVVEDARRKLEVVKNDMLQDARRLVASLEGVTGARRDELVRELQRVRLEHEGEALELIDATLAEE